MNSLNINRKTLLFLPLIFSSISILLIVLFQWSSGNSAILGLTLLAALILIAVFLEPSLPIVVFYPLLWGIWAYAVPRLGKPDAVIGYLALGAAIIHVIVKRDTLPKMPKYSVVGIFLLLFGYIASWFLSDSVSQGYAFVVSLSTRILFMYLVFLHIRTANQLKWTLILYLISSFFSAFVVLFLSITYGFGFTRMYGVSSQIQADIGMLLYRIAISFSFGGASALLIFGLYPLMRNLYQRWLIISVVLFLFWMVFSAEYRREIILSFILLFLFLSIGRTKEIRRPSIGILIFATVLFVVALIPNSPVLQDRLGRETDVARAGDELRQISFRAGVEAFLDSSIFLGSGPGSYTQVVTPRVEPRYYLAYGLHRVDAFNVFIWIAVEGGLLGLVGYLLILFGVYKQARAAGQSVKNGVAAWLLRCAPALLLQIILWSNFGNAWEVSMPWFLMGLILAAARLAQEKATGQSDTMLSGEL